MNSKDAIEFAIKMLRYYRMDYEPGATKYEVIYGEWDMEEYAANKYTEYTEAIDRLENLLKGDSEDD